MGITMGIMSGLSIVFALLPLILLVWIGFRVHFIYRELQAIRWLLENNSSGDDTPPRGY